MQLKFRTSMLSLSIGLALAHTPAYSTTITTYNNSAAWQAATSAGYQTVTFEGLTPAGTATNYNGANGVTADGVNFIGYSTAGSSDIQVVDTSAFSWYDWGTGDALVQNLGRPNAGSPLPLCQHCSASEYYLARPGSFHHQPASAELQHHGGREPIHGSHLQPAHAGFLGNHIGHAHHFAPAHFAGHHLEQRLE